MRFRALVLFAIAAGCRVDAVDGTAYRGGPRNACELGCAADVGCVDGACVAAQTNYRMVFEVTPPSSASFGRGITFTFPSSGNLDRGKGGGGYHLTLVEPARVVAELHSGTTLPVTLRLRKVDAVPGAARAVFEASSFPDSAETPVLAIPTGDYEVFVAPSRPSDLAVLPPVHLRDDKTGAPLVQRFASGAQKLVVSYASTLRTLAVSLTNNAGDPLVKANEARDLYVVDETTGELASTVARTCVTYGAPLASDVTLTLAPALTGHRYTLRIAPAATRCAEGGPLATVDFDLQALDVEGRGGRVVLAMPPTLPVLATATVTAFGSGATINDSTILLRSQQLAPEVDAKKGHAFVELAVDAGTIFRNALKGSYRAVVIPGASIKAGGGYPYAICVDCTVPSPDPASPGTRTVDFDIDTGTSLDFQLARRVQVTLGAAGFDGELFGLGTFEAGGSSSLSLDTATGAPLLTRSAAGAVTPTEEKGTGKQWNVAASLDPGVYDFVIRTPEASGYPWIVLPSIQVKPAPRLDLGIVKAAAPVVFSGQVRDPSSSPVPRAIVRVRAFIGDKTPPQAAVLVGETRADDDGNYRIAVPSDFSALATVPAK